MNDRRCIVTRDSLPADAMIRFVAGPDGVVVPDLKTRLPGRGAWVTAQRDLVQRAARQNAFAHALKQQVQAADDLPDLVATLLCERALASLGLAARAGAVVTGFTKVDGATRSGDLSVVLSAADGADDGRRKIAGAILSAPNPVLHVTSMTTGQLSLALGRPNVVHAGVATGRVAASLKTAMTRYEIYCGGAAASVRAA